MQEADENPGQTTLGLAHPQTTLSPLSKGRPLNSVQGAQAQHRSSCNIDHKSRCMPVQSLQADYNTLPNT